MHIAPGQHPTLAHTLLQHSGYNPFRWAACVNCGQRYVRIEPRGKMSQRQLELGDDSGAIKLAGLPFIGNHLLFFQAIQVGFENPQVTVSQNPTVSLFRRYERCCCPAEDH